MDTKGKKWGQILLVLKNYSKKNIIIDLIYLLKNNNLLNIIIFKEKYIQKIYSFYLRPLEFELKSFFLDEWFFLQPIQRIPSSPGN